LPIVPFSRIAESITYVESMRDWGSNPPPATNLINKLQAFGFLFNWVHWVQQQIQIPLCLPSNGDNQLLHCCGHTHQLFPKRNAQSIANCKWVGVSWVRRNVTRECRKACAPAFWIPTAHQTRRRACRRRQDWLAHVSPFLLEPAALSGGRHQSPTRTAAARVDLCP